MCDFNKLATHAGLLPYNSAGLHVKDEGRPFACVAQRPAHEGTVFDHVAFAALGQQV